MPVSDDERNAAAYRGIETLLIVVGVWINWIALGTLIAMTGGPAG